MIVIKGEKKPTTCRDCWAYEEVDVRGVYMGLCLITRELLSLKHECPLEEVDDDER